MSIIDLPPVWLNDPPAIEWWSRLTPPYSGCIATNGLTRAARRAGTRLATTAIAISAAATPAYVMTSVLAMPYSRLSTYRDNSKADTKPDRYSRECENHSALHNQPLHRTRIRAQGNAAVRFHAGAD